jgi:hypothetical protein
MAVPLKFMEDTGIRAKELSALLNKSGIFLTDEEEEQERDRLMRSPETLEEMFDELESVIMQGTISFYLDADKKQALVYALRGKDSKQIQFLAGGLRNTAKEFSDLADQLDKFVVKVK